MKTLSVNSISFFFAFLMLFISCSQYENKSTLPDTKQNRESLSLLESINAVKPSNISSISDTEISIEVLKNVNSYYGTKIVLDNEIHAYAELDAAEILPQAVTDGIITELEKTIITNYVDNYVISGKSSALDSMLSDNSRITDLVVKNRMNNLLDIYKSAELVVDINLDNNVVTEGAGCNKWRCAMATLALVAATAAVAGGAPTIGGALLAMVLHANATMAFMDKCGPCIK